jgi:negative regulator of genetic competence, sporulation and motility
MLGRVAEDASISGKGSSEPNGHRQSFRVFLTFLDFLDVVTLVKHVPFALVLPSAFVLSPSD